MSTPPPARMAAKTGPGPMRCARPAVAKVATMGIASDSMGTPRGSRSAR